MWGALIKIKWARVGLKSGMDDLWFTRRMNCWSSVFTSCRTLLRLRVQTHVPITRVSLFFTGGHVIAVLVDV